METQKFEKLGGAKNIFSQIECNELDSRKLTGMKERDVIFFVLGNKRSIRNPEGIVCYLPLMSILLRANRVLSGKVEEIKRIIETVTRQGSSPTGSTDRRVKSAAICYFERESGIQATGLFSLISHPNSSQKIRQSSTGNLFQLCC